MISPGENEDHEDEDTAVVAAEVEEATMIQIISCRKRLTHG
jgi:hypothetical protein